MEAGKIERISAFAPATVANLGVGFDILGLAVNEPGDRVTAMRSDRAGVRIVEIHGDAGKLPRDRRNTAVIAAEGVLQKVADPVGIELIIEKGLPLASGLGSSAASAVAAAVAVNALLGKPLQRSALLSVCLEAEAAVSGRHADNVAPALYGGIVLLSGETVQALPIPTDLVLCLITPEIPIATASARALLPQCVPLKQLVQQTAALGRLIDALHHNDLRAAVQAMESDTIIEPARRDLILALDEARRAAKAAGAYGLIISGAGPTLCAFCANHSAAARCAQAVSEVYQNQHIPCQTFLTRISDRGAHLIEPH